MSERKHSNTLLLPLVAGLSGAFLALLLAPRSGRETRRQLQLAAGDMKEKAAEGLDTARASVEESLARAKEVKDRLSSAIKFGDKKLHNNNSERSQDSTALPPIRTWEEEV